MPFPLAALLVEFPPIVCRLLARELHAKGAAQRVLSDDEIAARSGLNLYHVRMLSELHSWDSVPVHDMDRFTKGCGIDFDDHASVRRHRRYMTAKGRPVSIRGEVRKIPTWRYLRKDASWDLRWRMMIQRHNNYLNAQSPQ